MPRAAAWLGRSWRVDFAKLAQGRARAARYPCNMKNRKVALVTGANKGIGLAIAKQLLERGFTVLLGVRDLGRGEAAAKRLGGEAHAVQLDVTSADSIAAAAEHIRAEYGRLDVLINNAGIARMANGGESSLEDIRRRGAPTTASVAEVRAVFETNVFGVIAVTQAMLPLLRESPAGRIVNLSSGLGSLSSITAPDWPGRGIGGVAYGPSKSALNAVTVAFAQELEGTRIKVNAACPGFTATDLNGHSGPRSVEQAAREPVRLAMLPVDGPTCTLSNDEGPLGW